MKIKIKELSAYNHLEITHLFKNTFEASEGEIEGKIIGNLASELSSVIDSSNVSCVGAFHQDSLIGAAFITTLWFDQDFNVQMLAPVAVATDFQRKGVGQQLITEVIERLTKKGIDMLITYGDPNYYSKVGFSGLDVKEVPAHLPLSMPIGWLGQTLNRSKPAQLTGPRCVKQFENPHLW